MQDDSKEFSVLVDRAIGGSSIVDGEIELMLHRYFITFSHLQLITINSHSLSQHILRHN